MEAGLPQFNNSWWRSWKIQRMSIQPKNRDQRVEALKVAMNRRRWAECYDGHGNTGSYRCERSSDG